MVAGETGTPNLLRILHVSEAYGGGVQTAIDDYIENTPGVAHYVVSKKRVAHDTGAVSPAIEVIEAPASPVRFVKSVYGSISRIEPHIVHLHSSYAGLLRLGLRTRRYEVIYTPHCYAFERLDRSRFERAAYKLIERSLSVLKAHTIAGVSGFECSSAMKLGARGRVVHVPNSLRVPAAVASSRIKDRIGTDPTPVVVTVGRVDPQKDPRFFADVVRATKTAVRWIWIGGGDPELEQVLREVGVEVTGWLDRASVVTELAKSGLYLHTALWEGDPIAPLEARSLGVPVLLRRTSTTDQLHYELVESAAETAAHIDAYFQDPNYRCELLQRESGRLDVVSMESQRRALTALYKLDQRAHSVRAGA